MTEQPSQHARAVAPAMVRLSEVSHALSPDGPALLADLSLSVAAGERICVIGPSGCGKSTLLRLISGLAAPTSGSIVIEGSSESGGRRARCALAPQTDTLLPWARLDDNVGIALRARGWSRGRARMRAAQALERWGLRDRVHARPHELSGGMRQRAQLVRALLAERPVLLADEPLGALDAITRGNARRWVRQMLDVRSTTLVMVTHDIEEALLLGDRVIVLGGAPTTVIHECAGWGRATAPAEELIADPAFTAARRRLLDAIAEGVA